MRKKRFIAAVFALFILVAVSGCSQDSGGHENENSADFSNFESVSLQGEPVDGSVMKKAQLTVLNIWGTYCGPCLEEMPDLGKLSKEYQEKGVQIIGIPVDATSDQLQQTAKEIVSTTGANYLHILPSDDLDRIYLNQVMSIPETLFIDGSGRVIDSVIGSRSEEEWRQLIDNAYEQVTQND